MVVVVTGAGAGACYRYDMFLIHQKPRLQQRFQPNIRMNFAQCFYGFSQVRFIAQLHAQYRSDNSAVGSVIE